jgi:hypothetical protein
MEYILIKQRPRMLIRTGGSDRWAGLLGIHPNRVGFEDGKECWVVQTHPDAAKEIWDARDTSKPAGREKKIKDIRELAKEVILQDFLLAIPILAGDQNVDLPLVANAIGHSWSAAFPILSPGIRRWIPSLCRQTICGLWRLFELYREEL